MARFSANKEDDVGTSNNRPKRARTTTALRISNSPRRTDQSVTLVHIGGDSTDGSDNSTDNDSNSTDSSSDSEQEQQQIAVAINGNESGAVLSDTDVLDCPICLDPFTIPVFQCENGHLSCGSCCTKIMNKCPSCVMPIGYNRCRGMEKVLESVKASCQNRQHGCMKRISYCQKLDHEKSCKYAPCSCPSAGCNFIGMSADLYRHVLVQHVNTKFCFNAVSIILLLKRDTRIILREGKEQIVFVLNHVMNPLGSLLSVICVAPTSSDMKFSYDLTAALDGNLIKLESSMAVTPKFDARAPVKKFLLVTSDFFDREGKLRLELVIKRLD